MRGRDSPNHTFICLLESIKRPLNPMYTGKFSVTQEQSNSNLAQVCCCKGATLLMQAPGNWFKDLLTFTFWVFYYHQNELWLQVEFNLWSDSVAFQERWWGARLPAHAPFLCSLKWSKQAAYWEWADRVVETSEWFIISFSRSVRHYLHRCSEDPLMYGIAEPLTAQWTDKCCYKAVSLVCVPLCSCPQWKNNGRVRHWPPLPPRPKSSIILWKLSCFFSWNITLSPYNE